MSERTSKTIAQFAVETKAELIRRGPVAGELAISRFERWDHYANVSEVVYDVPKTDCKVCVLGAAGAAAFGDPDYGYAANDYDMALDSGADVDFVDSYARFIKALAYVVDVTEGNGDFEYASPDRLDLIDGGSANDTVTSWFDRTIKEEDPTVDASDRLGPILTVLDAVVARFPDTEKETA